MIRFVTNGAQWLFAVVAVTFLCPIVIPAQSNLHIEVEHQADSPVAITSVRVDSSAGRYHLIDYLIQNLSQKSIRTYVTTSFRCRSTTSYFHKPLAPGHVSQEHDRQEDANFARRPRSITLSVDYVLFSDGTTWGKNACGRAMEIEGFWDGMRAAVAWGRIYLEYKTDAELTRWLASDDNETNVSSSLLRRDDVVWQVGYNRGFRSMFHTLRKEHSQTRGQELLDRFKTIEKSIKK